MALDIGVPLNSVLLLAIAYYAQRILFPSITQPNKPPSEFKKGYSWSEQVAIAMAALQDAGEESLIEWTKDVRTPERHHGHGLLTRGCRF